MSTGGFQQAEWTPCSHARLNESMRVMQPNFPNPIVNSLLLKVTPQSWNLPRDTAHALTQSSWRLVWNATVPGERCHLHGNSSRRRNRRRPSQLPATPSRPTDQSEIWVINKVDNLENLMYHRFTGNRAVIKFHFGPLVVNLDTSSMYFLCRILNSMVFGLRPSYWKVWKFL